MLSKSSIPVLPAVNDNINYNLGMQPASQIQAGSPPTDYLYASPNLTFNPVNNTLVVNSAIVFNNTVSYGYSPGYLSALYFQMSQAGVLYPFTGTSRWYAPRNLSISAVTARVGTAPTGNAIAIAIKINGSTVNTLTIPIAGLTAGFTATINMSAGDYMTIDIVTVGSITAGSDLNVTFTYN